MDARICSSFTAPARRAAQALFPRAASTRRGVSLTELMIAVAVVTIGVVSIMGSFKYINRAITQSRIKTIAINLAQEEMEVLRNKSYFQLLVTTDTANTTGFDPNFPYDKVTYRPQTITLWGMPALTRVVNVDYVAQSGSDMVTLPYSANDPGMKKITVSVIWNDFNGTPRKVQVSSFYENPTATVLSSGFSGVVKNVATNNPVRDALVQVMGYPSWMDYTDADGKYSFQVSPGSYTLVCSSDVYFSSITVVRQAAANIVTTNDFALTKVPTGSVSGVAYLRDHLVISQVVGSSVNSSGQYQEWVEVYNPTTWTWTMATGLGTGGGTGSNQKVIFMYKEAAGPELFPKFDYRSVSLSPNTYFLFANTGTVTAAGYTKTASAVYGTDWDFSNVDDVIISGNPSPAGHIIMGDVTTMTPYDTVGWDATSNGAGNKKVAEKYETQAIVQSIGLEEGEGYTRKTTSASSQNWHGRCYDSGNNNSDMVGAKPFTNWPHDRYDSDNCDTGTPAAGAVVTANDGLSAAALVSANGSFLLTNIATSTVQGVNSTWTINITSAPGTTVVIGSSAGVTVPYNATKDLGTILFSSSTDGGVAMGYVFGGGPDYNKRLGSPPILVGSGGETRNTDSQGFYLLYLSTGLVTITANYGGANGSYQSSDIEVNLEAGVATSVPDFHLSQGGIITGYVTSGTGSLPDIIVQATYGGRVYSGTSDNTGHFYISVATSSLAYEVTPVLDSVQSYTSQPATPLTAMLNVAGTTVFAGTITVTGAMATIEGVLTKGGNSITTGVLVIASTAAISSPLPAIYGDSAPSGPVFYSASSQADGTYSLDVRYSTTSTYNLAAFYPVVDPNSGTVSYSTRSLTGFWVNTAGASVIKDLAW
jgi:type II secretory pathway pseudopilin PulG